jgi:hypothetical protein
MKSKIVLLFSVRITLVFWFLVHSASATLINLNDFTKDPTVTVAVDGSSAVIAEDSALSVVLLSNNPALGDPNVIFPASGLTLLFDYAFVQPPPNNQDEFGAFVVDAASGGSAGSAFEFFTQTASSGTVGFDLSSLASSTIGLQFQLSALPGDAALDSTVTISNVRLEALAVLEPGSGSLILAGLCGMVLVKLHRVNARKPNPSLHIPSSN